MAIPDYQSIMLPLLNHVSDGNEVWIQDCFDVLADHFGLSQEEREEARESGETVFSNRVRWAKTYLAQAGLLESTRRGHFKITELGKKTLKEKPSRIDNGFLKQFPDFVSFMGRSSAHKDRAVNEAATGPTASSTQTPEERIDEAHSEIEDALRADLLKQILKASPAFFERLILKLMLSMGYGGEWQNSTKHSGKPGDGGIDGIINEDRLGLDAIYLQAKRYQLDATIPEADIRGFSGALTVRGATKGVFVTTCKFSVAAREFVLQNRQQKIILIDGNDLTRLMIDYEVGVRTEREIKIKRIVMDSFDEYEGG